MVTVFSSRLTAILADCPDWMVVALEAEIPQILFVSFHLNASLPSEEGTSRRCGMKLRVTPLSGVLQKDVPHRSEIVIGSESRWRAEFGSLRNPG